MYSRVAIALIAGYALAGCESTPVVTDSNAGVSLGVCRTYQWTVEPASDPLANHAFDNPINDERLRTAIAKRLAAHGISPAADGKTADCLVSHAIGTRTSVDPEHRGPRIGFGIGSGWGGYYGRGTMGAIGIDASEPFQYREGRIAMDVFRASTHVALWHADAEVDVSSLTGADAEQRIDKVVAAIFAKFPATAR
jgi:hypothetical protein